MEDKAKQPYRDLEESEVEALFSFYDKHNGNVLEMTKDKDIIFKAKSQIYYYRDKYDFITKLSKIKTARAKKFKEEWEAKLREGKSKAIEEAIKLLQPRTIQKTTKDGDVIDLAMFPDNKDIKTAYEIIKIELGEPTTISKNTNVDETEVEKALNILKNGIEESDTIIPDRQQDSKLNSNAIEDSGNNSEEEAQKSDNDTPNAIREESISSTSSNN